MIRNVAVVMCLCVAGVLVFASGAGAWPVYAPGINHRIQGQDARIDRGFHSGQLTGREAWRLETRLDRIRAQERRMSADGVLSWRERARLRGELNSLNRSIYREKHDRQRTYWR